MERFTFKRFSPTQYQVYFYKKHVAYCGNQPGAFAYFLFGCELTDNEKIDVMRAITEKFGEPRYTPQTEEFRPT